MYIDPDNNYIHYNLQVSYSEPHLEDINISPCDKKLLSLKIYNLYQYISFEVNI